MDNIIKLINDEKYELVYKLLKKNKMVNESIIDKNNLIHLLAIRGKDYILKLLEKESVDIFASNGRGENILHLLLRNGWDKLALDIVKIHPRLLDLQNIAKYYPISLSVNRLDTLIKLCKILIEKEYYEQINYVSIENTNLITKIIEAIDDEPKIIEILKMFNYQIDYKLPKDKPILIYSIMAKKYIVTKYLISNNNGINIPNNLNLYPIHAIITHRNLSLLQSLMNSKEFDFNILNHGGPMNKFLPLNMCLNLLNSLGMEKNILSKNILSMTELIFSNIKMYDSIDLYKNLYGHYAADIKMKYKINKKTILDKIISKSDKTLKNLDGITINDILKNKKIDTTKSRCNIKLSKDNKILFPEFNFKSNTGLFNSDIIHNMIYFLYILRENNDAIMPIIKETENSQKIRDDIISKLDMQDIPYDQYYMGMRDILGLGYELFHTMMPTLILWVNRNLYWFDPNFEEAIEQTIKSDKRFIIIKVSYLNQPDSLHANVIIYDKNDASYRRFEPYGNLSSYDEMYLDKLVMDQILKFKKNKIKYYTPGDFLEKGRFQTISNDGDIDNKKSGDPFGYCLAWCLWYVEIKLKNPDIPESKLISLASEKIFVEYCDSNTPYIDFIRDYARNLNDEKDKMFEKFGLDKNNFYNMSYNLDDLNKISKGIEKIVKKI
jgi:hypothetical protein